MTASVDRRPRWRRRLDRLVHEPYLIVLDLLGDGSVGGHSVPTEWRYDKIKSDDRHAGYLWISTDNDAFAVRVNRHYEDEPSGARPSEWVNLNRREARAVAWWILRWWAAEWFGVRRAIYYWALHRHVGRHKARYHR